jgi:hypothetical protein
VWLFGVCSRQYVKSTSSYFIERSLYKDKRMNSTVSTWTCILRMPAKGLYFFARSVIKSRMHSLRINKEFLYCDYAGCKKDNLQSEVLLLTEWNGHTIAQIFIHQLLTTDAPFQSQGSPCGICGVQNDTGADFNLNTSDFSCQILFYECPILIFYLGQVQYAPFRPQYETQSHLISANKLKFYYFYFP